MTAEEIGKNVSDYISKHSEVKFTGQIRFIVHLKDGGVPRVQVESMHDMEIKKG